MKVNNPYTGTIGQNSLHNNIVIHIINTMKKRSHEAHSKITIISVEYINTGTQH